MNDRQEQLEAIATELENEAFFLQCEADDARGHAEEAWQEYYSYDPEEDEDA